MSAPQVSVIIPSYNGERFIGEAVQSILGQTFPDFELIVLDDGSSDGTRDILRGLARGDSRLRIIEKANSGLIETLNQGIAEARGAYIARLDHDDVATPKRLELQAAILSANRDIAGVGCQLQNIAENGTPVGPPSAPVKRMDHRPDAFPPRQQWLYGPTPMIRAQALRQAGGYRRQFVAAEDRDLCWRLGALGRLVRIEQPLVLHRSHGGNMSQLRRRTQLYSALLGDLSAISAHFRLDDTGIVAGIDVGGDYGPQLDAYRSLLASYYPVDTYLLYFQMRWELWDLPGHPDRAGMAAAVLRHAAARPFDRARLHLLRKSLIYLVRKSRANEKS